MTAGNSERMRNVESGKSRRKLELVILAASERQAAGRKKGFSRGMSFVTQLMPPLKGQAVRPHRGERKIRDRYVEFNEIFNDWANTGGRGKNARNNASHITDGRNEANRPLFACNREAFASHASALTKKRAFAAGYAEHVAVKSVICQHRELLTGLHD